MRKCPKARFTQESTNSIFEGRFQLQQYAKVVANRSLVPSKHGFRDAHDVFSKEMLFKCTGLSTPFTCQFSILAVV